MKLSINTEVLKRHNLSIGEFLLLLMGYYDIDYKMTFDNLVNKKLLETNLFKELSPVMSDNTKNMVATILMESDERAIKSKIDFLSLASKLQSIYPSGNKPGSTYLWRGNSTEEIAQKLRVLVVKHNFEFTEQEAIDATKEYVNSFKDFKYMTLLKYFLLKTSKDEQGHMEIDSMFMTIIENNRNNET